MKKIRAFIPLSVPKHTTLLAIVVNLFLFACDQKATEEMLPNELAGIYLVKLEKNEVAKNKLAGMHHSVDFADYESVIGTYWDGKNQTKVYLTIFDDMEKSIEMINAMARNIKAGKSSEFHYIEQFERDGSTIHLARSESFNHYFFQDDKHNIWITAPTERGEEVLNDFLNKFYID